MDFRATRTYSLRGPGAAEIRSETAYPIPIECMPSEREQIVKWKFISIALAKQPEYEISEDEIVQRDWHVKTFQTEHLKSFL